MYLVGKAYYDEANLVRLATKHRKFVIMYLFNNEDESRKFYEKFNYKEKGLIFRRIRISVCNHKNQHKLDVGNDSYHYMYCPDCKRGLYIDEETPADKQRQKEAFALRLEKEELHKLRSEVKMLRNRLNRREKLLNKVEQEYSEHLANFEAKANNNAAKMVNNYNPVNTNESEIS